MTTRHYQIGRLPFSMEGDSAFAEALAAEFAPVLVEGRGAASQHAGVPLRFSVVDRLTPFPETVAMAPVTVAPDGFAFQAGKVKYQVRRDAQGLAVQVNAPRAGFPRELAP